MPKKRPFFEYKGMPGLMESIDKMAGNRPPDATFRSDDIPYMNEGDGYGRSRHHHHHRSRSRSRSRSKSRSRSRSRTHANSRPRSHHHHHHYHHHHHHRDRRRRDRDRDRDVHRSSQRELEQQAEGQQQRPATKPPVAFADDDRNNSSNPFPESIYPPHRTVQDQAVHAQKVAEAERVAQASAAATALAAGVGAAAVTGMAMNSQQPQYPQPPQQHQPYLPDNINNSPPRPPSDIHLSQAGEDEGPGMYGQPQQNPVPANTYRPNSGINVPIEDGRQKTILQRLLDGVKDALPRRFQQKDYVDVDMYGDQMSESQGRVTLGGISQVFRTQPMTANPSGVTPSQTGMTQGGGGGGPMSEFTHHSRTSELKSKDEVAKEKRNRQMRRAGKLALGAAGVAAASALFRAWMKSRNRKNEAETDAGGDSDDDDDDDDGDSRLHGGGGGGGDKGSSNGGRVNPLRMKPPQALFSAKAPQGETLIIERSGKYHREVSGGTVLLIPWMDRVAFRHTKREFGFPLRPTECFTRDSVGVDVTALMFLKVEDAVAASYEVQNLSHSLQLMGLSCMKKEIVSVTLTHFFSKRDALTERIVRAMNAAIRPWGLRCTRFEFEHLDLPPEIRDSMEREARAERLRHADILHSEGQRQALINKADAEMQAQMRMSQARQMDIVNQAIGEAHAIQERGEAIANAMRDVAEVVNEPGGEQALRLRIAEQYINAYAAANQGRNNGGPVNGSDDIMSPNYGQQQPGVNNPPHDPAQVVQHMGNALGLLSTLGDPNVANPYGVPPPGHPRHAHPQSQPQPQPYNARRRQRPVGGSGVAAMTAAASAGLRPPPVGHQHDDDHAGSPALHHHHDMAGYSSPPPNMPVHPQHAAAGDAYSNANTIIVDGDEDEEDDEDDDLYEPAVGPMMSGAYNNNRYGQGRPQRQQQQGSGVRIVKHNEFLEDDDDDDDDERMQSPPKRHGYYAAASPSA